MALRVVTQAHQRHCAQNTCRAVQLPLVVVWCVRARLCVCGVCGVFAIEIVGLAYKHVAYTGTRHMVRCGGSLEPG